MTKDDCQIYRDAYNAERNRIISEKARIDAQRDLKETLDRLLFEGMQNQAQYVPDRKIQDPPVEGEFSKQYKSRKLDD